MQTEWTHNVNTFGGYATYREWLEHRAHQHHPIVQSVQWGWRQPPRTDYVRLALNIEADAKNRAAQELARDRWIEQRNANRIAAAKRAKASKILRRLSLGAALSDHDYIGAMFHLYAHERYRVL